MNVLKEKGLTFGSHSVFMLIYLFAESANHQISFGITAKCEICAGFINPCNFIPTHRYSLNDDMRMDWFIGMNVSKNQFNGFTYYNCSTSRVPLTDVDPITRKEFHRTVGIEVDNTKTDACYHIQYFSTTLQDKECLIEYSGQSRENVMNVTVSTYSDRHQPGRRYNYPGKVLRIYRLHYKPEKCKRELFVRERRNHEVNTTSTQVLHFDPASHFLLRFDQFGRVGRTINGEFHVTVHSQRNCSTMDLGNLLKEDTPSIKLLGKTVAFLTHDCSATSFNIKRNAFLSFYNLLPWSRITFNIEFENPALCHDNKHSLFFILSPYTGDSRRPPGRSFGWVVNERYIRWTVPSSQSRYFVFISIYQMPNRDTLTSFEQFLKPDFFKAMECTAPLHVTVRHHTSSVKKHTYQGMPSTTLTHCVSSVCYYIYEKSRNTWESAADTCKKHKQQLLTINSDFESNLLNTITQEYTHLPDSPVLFLNLRRDVKVSDI